MTGSEPAIRPKVGIPMTLSALALALSWLLFLLQLAGGPLGTVAAIVALPLAAAIGFLADYRYLGTALVLCLPALAVNTAAVTNDLGAAPGLALSFPNAVVEVEVAGVSLLAPLTLMLGAFCRILLDGSRSIRRSRSPIPRWALVASLVALGFAGAGALLGQRTGLNGWSAGVRSILAIGGFLWGLAVARRAGRRSGRLIGGSLRIVLVGAVLFVVGVLRGHLFFLLVGVSSSTALLWYRRRRVGRMALSAIPALAGIASLSLTTAASVLVAGGLFILAEMPLPVVRRVLIRAAVFVGLVTSGVMMWLVLTRVGAAFAFAPDTRREAGLATYISFKIMADRGPLWLAAAQQILAGPYLVMPAGRPLFPDLFGPAFFTGGVSVGGEWNNGAHNSVLELVRNVGLVSGILGVTLMVWAVVCGMRVVVHSRRLGLRALAAAFVAVAITGVTTGNFPVQDVGFFIWGLGGLAVGLHAESAGRRPGRRPRRAFARAAMHS